MRIAVLLFGERVSPQFGGTSRVLVVEIDGGQVLKEEIQDIGKKRPMEFARLLLELGADKIICGGINKYHKEWLERKGIAVLDNRMGSARGILQELVEVESKKGKGHR